MFQQESRFQSQDLKYRNKAVSNGLTLFRAEDITVSFGDIVALKNVHFKIDLGEIIFVTGASGAGKTTFLRLLSSEVSNYKGRFYCSKDLETGTLFTSKVFQDLRLIGGWTCEENLMTSYDPSAYRSKKDFMSDMYEISKVLGLYNRLNLKVKNANGGLKQKVAIARALLTKPDIFIADEPTSSLDSENAQRIFDVLSLYNTKNKMTVIWASHNKELVKRFSGRNIHLDNGRLVYSGHACFI